MKPAMFIRAGLLFFCFLFADGAVAASHQATEIEPMVVTATKTPKNQENIPAVVTVIDPEEIETIPAQTIGDLLAHLPGVYVSEPQGVGLVTPQSITMGGNGFPGATLILLDGQKINTPFTDYAYLTTLPVRAVDRIEVIRGPFSALYGSSAGGGVINIITKDGGNKSYVTPWSQVGDFGRYDYGLDAGIVWGGFSLGLFFDQKHTDNYYLYDDQGIDDSNREYDHTRFHGKLTGTLGDATYLSISGGTVDGRTGYGLSDNLGLENRQDVQHPYLNFQLNSQLSADFDLNAQLDWLQASHEYRGETLESITYPPYPPPIPSFNYVASLNDTCSDRYRGDISGNYAFNEENILTLGVEMVYTEAEKAIYAADSGELIDVQGRSGEKSEKNDTLSSLYAQYDWLFLERFELIAGARFDDYDSYGSEFSPKGALNWRYGENGSFKISAGKGFKAPNLNQLYSPPWSISPFVVYQGNPDLEAEILWSYQASLEQRLPDQKLFLRLTPYLTDAENFITSVRTEDPINPGGLIMQPQNVDEVKIKGMDAELSYAPLESLTLFVNYNYNETRDGETDAILDGYPLNSGSAGVRVQHRIAEDWRLFGSYCARYRGEYQSTSWGNPPVTETFGDYWYHTVRLGGRWREMVMLDLNLFNLFNDRSEVEMDDYLPEFNYLASVSFTYQF